MSVNTEAAVERLLVDEREAARLINVSQRTLFGLRQRGEIPFVQISPNRLGYSLRSLAKWVESRQSIAQSGDQSH
jgi:hypothetical protein